jgi:hypothetical protein
MAKVGILTQPLGTNYGGILQAFALQHVLREMGHQAIILNRVRPWYFKVAHWGWGSLNYLLGKRHKIRMAPNAKELDVITQHTSRFIKENISITNPIDSTRMLKEFVNNEQFGAIIVGSDQVWRKAYSPCMPNYFLDFLSGNEQIKKISYAASFGIDEWEFGKKETKYYKELAQEFDAISVREDSAVKLCREYLGVNATHVLDPTMLVDKSVYESLAMSPITHPSEGDLFCYILDRTPQKMSFVDKVAKEKSLNSFELLPKRTFAEIKSNKELSDCVFSPVEQWLRSFIDAKLVITDSFHGTVFSILFNKPVIVILNDGRGTTRMASILDRCVEDENYCVFSYNDCNLDKIDIDKLIISRYNKIEICKQGSIKFLKEALL